MPENKRKLIGGVLYWGLLLLLCWLGIRYVLLWLLPFLIALGVSYLMEPTVCYLREKLRLRRGLSLRSAPSPLSARFSACAGRSG